MSLIEEFLEGLRDYWNKHYKKFPFRTKLRKKCNYNSPKRENIKKEIIT